MEIANNIGDILTIIFNFISQDFPYLPFSYLDFLVWSMIAIVLAHFYRKVMGD